MADTVRLHVTVPREIAVAFARLVGERNQSSEIAALMKAKLEREQLARFFEEKAGFVSAEDHPEWATTEDVNEWVRRLRAEEWFPPREDGSQEG
jgi:hypothetical protein